MVRRLYETEIFEVYSRRIANQLLQRGFVIQCTRPDKKETGRKIFVFRNTPELRQAFNECLE